MKFDIIPNAECFGTIEANSEKEAMEKFLINMNPDMKAYFKVITVEDNPQTTVCDA